MFICFFSPKIRLDLKNLKHFFIKYLVLVQHSLPYSSPTAVFFYFLTAINNFSPFVITERFVKTVLKK